MTVSSAERRAYEAYWDRIEREFARFGWTPCGGTAVVWDYEFSGKFRRPYKVRMILKEGAARWECPFCRKAESKPRTSLSWSNSSRVELHMIAKHGMTKRP